MVMVQAGLAGAWEVFTQLGASATVSSTPPNPVLGQQVELEEARVMEKVR